MGDISPDIVVGTVAVVALFTIVFTLFVVIWNARNDNC